MNKTVKIVLFAVAGVSMLIGIVVALGFVCLLSMSGIPDVQTSEHPQAYAEAKPLFSGLPSTASNILSARASVGMGGRASLYRFDAPADDCLAHAQLLINRSNGNSDSNHQVSTELIAITASPEPLAANMRRAYGLEKVDWFDVENVRNGFTGHGPPSGLSSFWIDTDRNRFYYYWTD